MVPDKASRPVRLIMINSGKFSYGEVDLSSPVHLVGQNNVGKTTLISTLQFLYIDNQNQMSFSRPMDETRRYYFPDMKSYILFECLTPTGYMVMGTRGLGVLKRNEFERFIYSGTYEREDFIDPETGNVRAFDEISMDLSSRGYICIKPSELRDSLTATGRGDIPSLGLVPVRNRHDYDKFRKIFRNLLRLAHLSQEDLKKFLIDVNASDLKRTELDLTRDFSDAYRQVQKNVKALSDLKASSETAEKILALNSRRSFTEKELPPLFSAMTEAVKREKSDLAGRKDSLQSSLEEVTSEETFCSKRLRVITGQTGELQRTAGLLEGRLSDFASLGESVADYMEELEQSALDSLRTTLTDTQLALRDAAEGDKDRTLRRIRQAEASRLSLSEQLRNIEKLAFSSLPELSPGAISALRLFNERLLRFPEGPEGIEIKNLEKLLATLEYLGSQVDDKERFNDPLLSINLSSVPRPDLLQLTDPDSLLSEIADLRSLIEREKRVLEAIEKRQNLEAEVKILQKDISERESRKSSWLRYRESAEAAVSWKKDLDEAGEKLKELLGEQEQIRENLQGMEEREKHLAREKDRIDEDLRRLENRASSLPVAEEGWTEVSAVLESDSDAMSLMDSFRKKYDERNHLSERIQDNLSVLEKATYEVYRVSDEKAALEKLRLDMDAIGEQEDALRKLWSGLASDVSQSMKSLIDSLDTLKRKVSTLNSRLSKISVSDLKQLKLVLTENSSLIGHVKKGIEGDEMPLFTDRGQVEKALESLGKILETSGGGRIELRDLFNLNFEILNASGKTRKFSRLENIESNGTTITIKVLVNLILLMDLLPGGKARIPFYLDEASSLDRDNLASVVDRASEMGFPAVLASPEAMDVANRIYFMKDTGGRVYLDPELSCVEVSRTAEKRNTDEQTLL